MAQRIGGGFVEARGMEQRGVGKGLGERRKNGGEVRAR